MSEDTETNKLAEADKQGGQLERLVMLHDNSEVPENRRECLVTTNFSIEPYLAKYNESTGKWMIAFEKDLPAKNAQIKSWVYVDEIFAT